MQQNTWPDLIFFIFYFKFALKFDIFSAWHVSAFHKGTLLIVIKTYIYLE